jgi:aminoglycoside/choline kinase family phosphotransferase
MSLPRTLTQLTPEWITEVLHPRFDGRVSAVQITNHGGGIAVTSTVSRLVLTVEGGPDFPRSLVAKVLNPAWTRGDEPHRREHRFYTELATTHALPAPRCYFSGIDPDGAFVLLLEDLSEARPGHRLGGWSVEEAGLVVDALADLHGAWWRSPTLTSWPRRTYDQANVLRMQDRFLEFWPRLVEGGQFAVSPAVADAATRLTGQLADTVALQRGPSTLSHSDIHAENVFIDRRSDRVVFVDWQNAGAAHPAFDLAGVAYVCTRPDAHAFAEGLIRRYHSRLAKPIPLDDLRAAVRSAVRWTAAGIIRWLVLFEEENLRDATTVQGHWQRVASAMVAVDA